MKSSIRVIAWIAVSFLTLCLFTVQSLADTSASFDVPIELHPSDPPERYIFRIPNSSDYIFVDFVQCKNAFHLVLEWRGAQNPFSSSSHPGDKDVLYFDLRATHADGRGGVPDFNVVIIYQYADLSSYMSHIQHRKEMRFGLYDTLADRWALFSPGADNSDPPTRVVSQGVSSVTDIKATTTTIGLFAENLHQDVLSKWKTTYNVDPDGQMHQYQFAISQGEQDYVWLNLQTQRIPFVFHMNLHDDKNPVPGAKLPSGTTGGIVFFDLVVENRNNVPEGTHCTLRYQYHNATTVKMHYVRKDTLTFAILKGNEWRRFKGNQQNNIFTSNLIQSTSELLDLTDATTRVGVFGEVHDKPINDPDGDSISSAPPNTGERGHAVWIVILSTLCAILTGATVRMIL